jgi:UDP-2-acetamido-3-amino-2,3-dideoxy-glucuronate N-acetyltransferase
MENKHWHHGTAEIEEGVLIGENVKIWNHSQIKKGAEIGDGCTIGHNCFIGSGAKLGKKVKVQSNTDIWDKITLEDYVFVGPSVVFTNDKNPRSKYPKDKEEWLPTLVKEGATIGANATIVCGITIGRFAMIGAGSVVTKDVPDYALFLGVPAKLSGWFCECGTKIEFKDEEAVCAKCQRKYEKKELVVRQKL